MAVMVVRARDEGPCTVPRTRSSVTGESSGSGAGRDVLVVVVVLRLSGARQFTLSAALKIFFDFSSVAMRRAMAWNACATSLSG